MAELASLSAEGQLGITRDDPFRVVELPQFLVSGAQDQAPNSIAAVEGGVSCWLAPGRSLVIGLRPGGDFVSDMTHGTVVFELAAPQDLAFLSMGTTLPPDALAEGRCAQTVFAGVKVLLTRTDATLRLHVDRPLAAYMTAWLREAATAL